MLFRQFINVIPLLLVHLNISISLRHETNDCHIVKYADSFGKPFPEC
jgi:hypothetical protein